MFLKIVYFEMTYFNYIILAICIANTAAYPLSSSCYNFPYVTREEWGARPSGSAVSRLDGPVPFVVIHHSYDPPACEDRESCVKSMRYIQDLHQIDNGWQDIGYNFGVGSDGAVYEGRGWETVGAHAAGVNARSIGIVLIGDWISSLPPAEQMQTTKELISAGVALGYIREDYQVVGHRQVTATECPGEALFHEISTWNNYVPALTIE